MKITIISPGSLPVPPVKGGAVETLIYELIKENSKEGNFEIDLFGCYDEYICETEMKKCKLHLFKTPRILDEIYKILNIKNHRLIKIKNLINEKLYIDYINNNIQSSDYLLIENKPHFIKSIKTNKECKKILHLHNSHIYSFDENTFNMYDKILCVSNYLKEELMKEHKIKGNKIDIWYNCVSDYFINKNNYNLEIIKNNLNINQDDYIIVFVGRIVPEKGVDKIIDALKISKNNNLKLLIIGSSWFNCEDKTDYFELLEKKSEEIKDKIIFTGYIDHELIPKYMSLANMIILPSVWNEPFGLTIVEAMSLGKIVISTKKGGIPEISKGKDIILLNDEELISNISKNIEYYYNNPIEGKVVGENAQKTILKFFTAKHYYRRFKEILDEL